MSRYILTGTPGSGKTSLINFFEISGYSVIKEAATDIIALKQSQGITEPWLKDDFVDSIVELQKERQIETPPLTPIQFHDRSVICSYALAKYLNCEPSQFLRDEINRIKREEVFYSDVFFIQNLGFCEPTDARKISFEDSLIFEKLHKDTYLECGYNLIEIEKEDLQSRANRIISHIKNNAK